MPFIVIEKMKTKSKDWKEETARNGAMKGKTQLATVASDVPWDLWDISHVFYRNPLSLDGSLSAQRDQTQINHIAYWKIAMDEFASCHHFRNNSINWITVIMQAVNQDVKFWWEVMTAQKTSLKLSTRSSSWLHPLERRRGNFLWVNNNYEGNFNLSS
jgi:hypothetical protein